MAGLEVGLGVDAVLGAFFVHGENARFPFGVGAQDAEPDVRNDPGVIPGNSLLDRFH